MSKEDNSKDELAPLNIMEYTFSEKMLFVDTTQIQKLAKVFPKIMKKDIKPFATLSLKEMEGQTPRVGGVTNLNHYLAIRCLVHTLYREACLTHKHKPPPEEIYDYLLSLKLSPECSRELLTILLTPNLFTNVPKVIRIYPSIIGTKWMIDLSYCQRDTIEMESNDSKIDILKKNINVLLFLQLSDGSQKVIGVRWHELGHLRLQIAEALRTAEEAEEALNVQEETDRENLRIMRAEGHL